MSKEIVFKIANTLALIPWLFMIFLPKFEITKLILNSYIIPILLGILYGFYIFTNLGNWNGGFGSLEEISKLFSNKEVLLAGWIHYLAFDLFVGTWEWSDSQLISLPHYFLVPCLFFTFMLGPIGFLLYILSKFIWLSYIR